MAEDCVNQAAVLAMLPERACVTERLNIHGFHANAAKFGNLAVYGSDALAIRALAGDDRGVGAPLHSASALYRSRSSVGRAA